MSIKISLKHKKIDIPSKIDFKMMMIYFDFKTVLKSFSYL